MMVKPEARSDSQGPKYELLLMTFAAIVVFFIYAKTLTGDFIFDDRHNIKDNPHIRLTQITARGLIRAAHQSPAPNRPLANISFALNYYFHGYHVVGYHLVNILIHITNGILLYLFIKTTLRTPGLRAGYSRYGWVPFFSAFLWMVHPIQTQSVSYIVQRMNSMAAMFYVLSVLFYAQARLAEEKTDKIASFSVCVFAGALAFASKEITATLPFFIFLYEWYFFQNLSLNWLKRRLPLAAGMLILLVICAVIYLGANPLAKITAAYQMHHSTMGQRVLTEFRVVVFYISLLLWPHPSRLNLDHDFPPSISWIEPASTLLSIGTILGAIGLAIVLGKRQRLISYCILWFFGNLVIESTVIGLETVFEHRNYLPSMLLILMAVLLCYRYINPKWLTPLMLSAVAAVFALWTYQRNEVWRAPLLIWKDCAEKSPHKPRPFNNLGVALADQGHFREAREQYLKALQIKPNYADPHANLGYDLARQGNMDEAVRHFETALKINPKYYEAHNNLGIALTIQGRNREAIEHLKEAITIKPDYAQAYNNLGVASKHLGFLQEAIDHFSAALRIDPQFAPAHNNLGMALAQGGRLDAAIEHFAKAVQIQPGYATARRNLEESLAKRNQSGSQSKK